TQHGGLPMAGNWMDERERDERDMRRADYEGRWPERGERQYQQYQSEGRSFRGANRYQGDGGYEGGRDKVFGERETGASYGGPSASTRGYGGGRKRQKPQNRGGGPAPRPGGNFAPP